MRGGKDESVRLFPLHVEYLELYVCVQKYTVAHGVWTLEYLRVLWGGFPVFGGQSMILAAGSRSIL